MSKLNIFFLTLTYLIANPLDDWVDQNKNVIKEKIKSVSFKIRLESGIDSKEYKILNGQIVIGERKQFRFEMGPRTVVSDGTLWKSYDDRTDQIFIQEPDKKMEKALFSWVKVKKLKSLPVKYNPDGSYKIKLIGNNNDVRAYFNSDTNVLDSILISTRDGFGSKIFNISISVADSVILDIGTKSSELFDLR
jgi:hypothetical protein